ncbi:hypothetical protein [Vogesella sp. LIG4]|uniref:hypothetical protein n=1 Tax=Vogesella sp. LIG4 TaxID=1192162 RepID=UPI000B5ABE84|nr:hypothetical protein [Vogesella sp. LIG4]
MEMDNEFQRLEALYRATTLDSLAPEQIQAIGHDELAKALALDGQNRIEGLNVEQVEARGDVSAWIVGYRFRSAPEKPDQPW